MAPLLTSVKLPFPLMVTTTIDAYTVKVVKSPLALLGQPRGHIMVLFDADIRIILKHVSDSVSTVTSMAISTLNPLAYVSQS
jgi:hypothetical protein